MIQYYKELEQNSKEWYEARCGVLTASNVKLLMTPSLKPSNNDKVRQLVYKVAVERATGYVTEEPMSWDMKRGHVEEDLAIDLYSKNNSEVANCGFITNDDNMVTIGYSPDGLVGDDGLIEVKSILNKHQIKTIVEDKVPDEYMLQIQTGLLVSGRKWLDFISYSNGMPMFVKRVEPNKDMQGSILDVIFNFEDRVKEIVRIYNENSFVMDKADRYDLNKLVKERYK